MAQNMKLIEAKTIGAGGVAAIDFTAIPQTYTDLKIVMSVRGDQAATYASAFISFNGSSTGFVNKFVYGEGATAAGFGGNTNQIADQNGDTSTANTFSNAEIYIPNYTLSNFKSFSVDSVTENNATTAFAELGALVGPSAAITSITISPNSTKKWLEHSTFYLYGISNAAISPTPYATGGAIYQDDTYFYHMFTSTGVLTPSQALSNVDYLVVAGGGGAGYGGGGGAGGLRCTVGATGGGGTLPSAISLASGTGYAVTIGAGGTGTTSYANGVQGTASSFIGGAISVSTVGGGGGGGTTPTTGGSGAGYGNNTTGSGTAGTANEGFAGGNGDSPRGGGGGGGAGAVGVSGNGAPAPSGFGGNGGSGVLTTIGGNATYYAGGGGGAHNGNANVSQGQGGAGGGGTGGTFGGVGKGGTDGLASTGGGGGACNMNAPTAGNGGSGIVIVRYAK